MLIYFYMKNLCVIIPHFVTVVILDVKEDTGELMEEAVEEVLEL